MCDNNALGRLSNLVHLDPRNLYPSNLEGLTSKEREEAEIAQLIQQLPNLADATRTMGREGAGSLGVFGDNSPQSMDPTKHSEYQESNPTVTDFAQYTKERQTRKIENSLQLRRELEKARKELAYLRKRKQEKELIIHQNLEKERLHHLSSITIEDRIRELESGEKKNLSGLVRSSPGLPQAGVLMDHKYPPYIDEEGDRLISELIKQRERTFRPSADSIEYIRENYPEQYIIMNGIYRNRFNKQQTQEQTQPRAKIGGLRMKKIRKRSIQKARMISKKKYQVLLTKKRSKKKLSKKEKKELDNSLFINYCKCIKKLKYDKKVKKGLEYPICTKSIYSNRKMKTPKGIQKKCKTYQ
jgi:hypothetical protein